MLKPLLTLALLATLTACTSNNITNADAFRAARKADNIGLAKTYLADNPRVWYEEETDQGSPWSITKGSRWNEWDTHFNGQSSNPGPWQTQGNSICRVVEETNDYFKLIERQDTPRYRLTYFFNGDSKITGYMISAANPDATEEEKANSNISRFDEIETWAKANHPDEWEYLRPGGSLDPTGDRAERTRALINEWRESVGLPAIG